MKGVSIGAAGVTQECVRQRPQRILMVSNRAPIVHERDTAGALVRRATDGGVATALSAVAEAVGVDWLACAGSEEDAALALRGQRVKLGNASRLSYVAPPAQAYELFYNAFCNPLLWFLQHGIWDQLQGKNTGLKALHAWQLGYLPVNQLVAERVAEALRRRVDRVMFHDYHFYVAPLFVRNLQPRAFLQHFVHVPWPDPAEWMRLPRKIPDSICRGLLANDRVVFQTPENVENFLATCDELLPDFRVDFRRGVVKGKERETRVWANPISVDAVDLHRRLFSPAAQCAAAALLPELGPKTIVRVDRLDPAKNIVAGFEAFGHLLQRHPEYRGRVRFLAFLQPSRASIPEYAGYTARVVAEAEEVNATFGTPSWQPVRLFIGQDRLRALTALRFYDVLLVNSLADGMNLVSKEGAVLNERDGVLVLSRSAGSYRDLAPGALGVEPGDVAGTAAALNEALGMDADERRRRADALRGVVLDHQLSGWLKRQLEDLGVQDEGQEDSLALHGTPRRFTLAG